MPSRKSCFNLTLYKKLLSRFWPMWGGLTVLASLVPLIFFLSLLRYQRLSDMANMRMEMQETYYIILTQVAPAFMLCYAVLCAMAVWTYLYQHRSVSLMHTLPVTRTNLFVTGCCAGLTFMLLPMAAAGTLLFLVSACFGLATPVAFLECAAGLVLLSLLNFGFATLCAMVTGSLLALPVFYFVGNFLAIILDALLATFTNVFFFGVNTSYSGAVEWLSPTVFIYQNVQYRHIWEERSHEDGGLYSVIVGVELEGLYLLLIYGLVGALLLAAAWLIYQRRPSESAGDVVSLAFMRPVFKLGVAVCSALSLGQLLYAIFSVVGDGDSLIRMGICMLVAGAVGFWIADMLVQKSLRVWKTTAVGAGIMAALTILVCVVVRFDLLGVERRMPDRDEITGVDFRLSGTSRGIMSLEAGLDDEYIDQLMEIHRNIVDRKEDILALTGSGTYSGYSPYDATYRTMDDVTVQTLRLTYYLKDGSTFQRSYPIPITRELLADQAHPAAQLDGLINDPGIQLKCISYGEGYRPHYVMISNPYYEEALYSLGHESLIAEMETWRDVSDPDDCQRLYDALTEDVRAGRWGYTDLLDGSTQESWLELHFELQRERSSPEGKTYDTEYDSFYIAYTPEMTSLTGALLELGVPASALQKPPHYMTEEERKEAGVTELPDGSYVWEDGAPYYSVDIPAQEQTAADPGEVSVTDVIVSGSANMGIIGGADGPTAVLVSGG